MAKIPQRALDRFYKESVGGLEVGQVGYVTPWSVHQDETGDLYIHQDCSYHKRPGDTVELPIKGQRDSNGQGCIIINQEDFCSMIDHPPSIIGKSTMVGANDLSLDGWLPIVWEGTTEIDIELPLDAAERLFEHVTKNKRK